jgi:hypothetical protein
MQKQLIISACILKSMTNLSFIPLLKKRSGILNQLTKIISLFIFLPIASHNWKISFIQLKISIFKYSRKKRYKKKNQAISSFSRLTEAYSIRAWYIAQVSLPVAVLKLRLRPFISGRKLFLFPFGDNTNKFVMQQLWKDWESHVLRPLMKIFLPYFTNG